MRLALAFGLLLSCFCVVGQTTQADFTIPSPVCLAERIKIENLSTNASQYFWDFCGGDLGQQPTANVVTNNFGGYGTRVEVAESAGQFLVFFYQVEQRHYLS